MQADAVSDADSMHWRFFGSRGRPKVALRKAGAVSDADSMHSRPSPATAAASGRRRPLGPASGQHRRCITQKNPARPSAPTRHTRQRIKTPMCRLGIRSEQTSDTHQLAAAAASSRHRPRSSSLLQRSPPTGFAKKNSGDAASRACRKRKPMQADAVSDANSMHWRFFGSRGRPKSPCVKPAPFQMQIQCTRDHHRARLRPRSATAPWPGKRPAPPVHHAKKSSAALGAHAPHAPTDKDTNVPARNPERADLRYAGAATRVVAD